MTWKVINIANPGTSTQFGADDTDKINKYLRGDVAVDTVLIKSNTGYGDGYLGIWNPAGTFKYLFQSGAIIANRDINIPLLGASDTLAFCGFDNLWTTTQTFKTTSTPALKIYKETNGAGAATNFYFNLRDSANNETNYVDIGAEIKDDTDGSEDGLFTVDTKIAGTTQEVLRLNDDGSGSLRCGGPNRRIEFRETGLTGTKVFTFPDSSGKVSVDTATETFTNKTIYSGHDFGHPAANIIRGTGVDNPYAGHPTGATLNRTGLYAANGDTEASGYVGGAFTAVGTGSVFRTDAEGYGRSFATGAVANNNAGLRHGSTRFRRVWTIYCIARFLISSTSDIRVFFGFSSATAEIAGETTLNNESGFGIGKRTGDTNWFTYRNDGDATEDSVDTTIAATSSMTTMEIQLDPTNAQFRIDGVAQTAQTTEIPSSSTDLAFHLEIETGAGAADKTISILPIFFRVGT